MYLSIFFLSRERDSFCFCYDIFRPDHSMVNFLCLAVFVPDVCKVAVVLKLRLKLSWNELECFKGKANSFRAKDLKGVIKLFTKFQTSIYLAKNNVGYVTNLKHITDECYSQCNMEALTHSYAKLNTVACKWLSKEKGCVFPNGT